MQQRKPVHETGSYGTADLPATKKDVIGKTLNPFRTDVSIFALMWMMSAMCMFPYAMMADKLVSHIAFFYCLVLSCIITCLSWQRSRAWQVYSIFCFLSAGFGYYVGQYAWDTFPPHHNRAVNGRAVALCIIVLYGCLVCALILGAFLPAWGYGVIGSSVRFAEERGWGWEPLAMQHMDFGCDWCGGSKDELVHAQDSCPERVKHDLLYHRVYWSGEPALDYVFNIANDHLFLGCVFSHPASHFTKFDRVFVMVIILVLVVFPVAAFTVWLAELHLLRTLLQALIVTLPRNMVKSELRKMSVRSHLLKEERDEALGSKFKRLIMKHFTRRTMMQCHNEQTVQYQEEAAGSTAYFKMIVVFITMVICYISYLVIHLRDEDTNNSDGFHETMLIDGNAVTTLGILLDNMDGLVFAFTLEPVIMMMHAMRAEDGPRKQGWFVGFFGQWWHERNEFGRLRPLGRVFATPRPVFESIHVAGTAVGSAMTDGPPTFHQDQVSNAEAVLVDLSHHRGSHTSSSYGVV